MGDGNMSKQGAAGASNNPWGWGPAAKDCRGPHGYWQGVTASTSHITPDRKQPGCPASPQGRLRQGKDVGLGRLQPGPLRKPGLLGRSVE